MNTNELKALFNQQAPNYDKQWAKMSPINNGLYFFMQSIFADMLKPHGILVSSDLASDVESTHFDGLLQLWFRVMAFRVDARSFGSHA